MQAAKLRDLLKNDLKFMRAPARKECFDAFWQYEKSPLGGLVSQKMVYRAMRSKLAPMKKFFGTQHHHEDFTRLP